MRDISNDMGSVQDLLPIADIDQDAVWLRGGGCRGVLAVGSINLALAGEAEQEAVLSGYRAFLNSLRFSLQVLVRIEPVDVGRYLGGLSTPSGTSPALTRLALDHETFVRRLAREHTLLDRRFFVVVPSGDDPPSSLATPLSLPGRRPGITANHRAALAVRTLAERCDQVAHGLAGLGLAARRLNGHELAELWYTMLSPSRAHRQPLPTITGSVVVRTQPGAEEVPHGG
jgi:hypothetical protein